jgi:hypothetical protein
LAAVLACDTAMKRFGRYALGVLVGVLVLLAVGVAAA